jgi:galactose mutarotase-like enzyme
VTGFPGDLDVHVTYRLSSPYDLRIRMNATALNKATPVNLVNHAYWNLGGHASGDVLRHLIQVFASRYTPVDMRVYDPDGGDRRRGGHAVRPAAAPGSSSSPAAVRSGTRCTGTGGVRA